MVSRSNAAMARPSKSNSANMRCRHFAVISGKCGCSARVTSTTTSRDVSFMGRREDIKHLLLTMLMRWRLRQDGVTTYATHNRDEVILILTDLAPMYSQTGRVTDICLGRGHNSPRHEIWSKTEILPCIPCFPW